MWTSPATVAKGSRLMLAVVPFKNLDRDPEMDFLSDGLTEEIITRLGTIDAAQLRVIARTSSMKYRETNQGPGTIARELGVQYDRIADPIL